MEQCTCPHCGKPHIKHHHAHRISMGIAAHDIPSTTFNRNNLEQALEPPFIQPIELKPLPSMLQVQMYAELPYEERKQRKSRTNKRKFNGF